MIDTITLPTEDVEDLRRAYMLSQPILPTDSEDIKAAKVAAWERGPRTTPHPIGPRKMRRQALKEYRHG